ncbi:MAG: indolepyruvate ferredoxin oxidoreductase subunit alpha [Desulfurococcaceae archaeon]
MILLEHPLLKPKGSKVFLLGNEAIARGALEAGICVATAYPGTPSTEIIEVLAEVADQCGIYVEWSVNEKTAFEAAYGAAISGVKSLTAMKHVGLNVAADILMSSAYSGVEDGFIVVSADDPSMHSSQNEQDNRWYGLISHLPVIEPSSSREAYRLIKEAYVLSSNYKIPVIFRSTTRISHTRMPIELEEDVFIDRKCKGFFKKDYERWVLVPANARKRKIELMKTWKTIAENEGRKPFVEIINPGSRKAIVASGLSYIYVKEALEILGSIDKVTLLKVNIPVPLPVKPVEEILEHADEVLVVEELDPVVELQLKNIAHSLGYKQRIIGKEVIPENYELSLETVYKPIAEFLGIPAKEPWISVGSVSTDPPVPPRPPVLCAGCPHRNTFYIVKTAANKAGLRNVVFTGDIGCYTLGYQKPFETQSTCFEMGGSIGVAHGLAKTIENPVIAVIGDSTFFHAGIPPALNAMYNDSNVIILVLDNLTTAMTGHQPHPGTGISATGKKANRILPEKILEAMGYKVLVINPLKVRESIEILAKALVQYKKNEKIAIISRMRCALEAVRLSRRKGITLPLFKVLDEKCTGCMACVKLTACPALVLEPGSNKPSIIQEICAGCGLCSSICPYNAIVVSNHPSENWENIWWE